MDLIEFQKSLYFHPMLWFSWTWRACLSSMCCTVNYWCFFSVTSFSIWLLSLVSSWRSSLGMCWTCPYSGIHLASALPGLGFLYWFSKSRCFGYNPWILLLTLSTHMTSFLLPMHHTIRKCFQLKENKIYIFSLLNLLRNTFTSDLFPLCRWTQFSTPHE